MKDPVGPFAAGGRLGRPLLRRDVGQQRLDLRRQLRVGTRLQEPAGLVGGGASPRPRASGRRRPPLWAWPLNRVASCKAAMTRAEISPSAGIRSSSTHRQPATPSAAAIRIVAARPAVIRRARRSARARPSAAAAVARASSARAASAARASSASRIRRWTPSR